MGCLCVKEDVSEEIVEKKTYSWYVGFYLKSFPEFSRSLSEMKISSRKAQDPLSTARLQRQRRPKTSEDSKKLLNPKGFIIEDLVDQEEIRLPGSINGQQFIIQDCKDSTIYVLDHMNTITIDDCANCKIILGPVEGSTFIRNCMSCTFVVACGQFRVRDCTKINVFLFSATQPIIEASSGIQFGSYKLKYNGIQEHFQKSNLNFKVKNWKFIYDFTPMECEENWSFMKNENIPDFIPNPKSEIVKTELTNLCHSWSFIEECENINQSS